MNEPEVLITHSSEAPCGVNFLQVIVGAKLIFSRWMPQQRPARLIQLAAHACALEEHNLHKPFRDKLKPESCLSSTN